MELAEQPLFGAGSRPSKHGNKLGGFLRPAAEHDGRLHPLSQAPQTTQIPASPINGTKAMRQTADGGTVQISHAAPLPPVAPQPQAPVATQPQMHQQAAPVAAQPQMQQQAATVATPPQSQQQAAPVAAQPQMQQHAVPAATQPQMQQRAVPVATHPHMQQHAVPAATQPQMYQQAAPVAAQLPVQQQQAPVAPQPQTPIAQTQQEIPEEPTGSEEDRIETRKRTLKGGLIILPGQMMSSYGCKIRNESRGGVMLVLSDAMLLPAEFYLVRDADPGHKIPCRIAWRGIGRVGVQFIAALAAP